MGVQIRVGVVVQMGGGVVVQMEVGWWFRWGGSDGVVVQMEVGWLFRWVRAADSDGGGVVVQMGVVQVGMVVQMRGGGGGVWSGGSDGDGVQVVKLAIVGMWNCKGANRQKLAEEVNGIVLQLRN